MNEPTIQILIFGGVVLAIGLFFERVARKKLHLEDRESSAGEPGRQLARPAAARTSPRRACPCVCSNKHKPAGFAVGKSGGGFVGGQSGVAP